MSHDDPYATPHPEVTRPFDLESGLRGLRGRASMLIYMHDNPDPDALAAAVGLKLLVEREIGAQVTLARGGIVGRAENRAMVEGARIALAPVESLDPSAFEAIGLVDSQPETGNNSLPAGHRVDVVIDHHPPRPGSARAPWCDIRPELGATSTIVLQYLLDRRIALDPLLATAFFFALRTETRDLGREATDAERAAYLHLVPQVDHKLLFRMSHPKVPRDHFVALDRALRSAEVYEDVVAVNLGDLSYPDLVAEVADLLLSFEGARFVLCFGRYSGVGYLSLRTDAGHGRAGSLMRRIVGADGAAGGHGTMAGARLFAALSDAHHLQRAFSDMVARLCTAVGRDPARPVPLVDR